MEAILRFPGLIDNNCLLWKKMFRGLVLVMGLIVLSLCAKAYGEEYSTMLREKSGADSMGRIDTIPERTNLLSIELMGNLNRTLPLNIAETFTLTGYKKGTRSREPISNVEKEPVIAAEVANGEVREPVAAALTVSLYGNGGTPELSEYMCEVDEFSIEALTCPKRLGKLFDGWYIDEECKIPFEEIGEEEILKLYAGWKEFPGFLSNDAGHIIGCTDSPDVTIDGFLRIPGYEECTGIESGAFDTVKEYVFEIFIPDNIVYIAPGAFDNMSNLMYIEVVSGNPAYYSDNGVLYYSDGRVACYPAGRR